MYNNSASTLASNSQTPIPITDKHDYDIQPDEAEEYEASPPHASSTHPADEELAEKRENEYTAGMSEEADGAPVSRVPTRVSINDVNAIPNGGLLAWLQVLGAWMLFFDTWGIINTFGAYQTYYESTFTTSTSSDISWIGSVQAFLLLFVGAMTGPLYDAGYFRELLLSGSFLVVFGQMMLSLCHTYWQAFLAQAICIGIGTGLLFVPSVSILSQYFSTRVAIAVGLAATGSSIGGVIYPIVFHRLQPTVGFGWATRVIGFMQLVTLVIPCTVMKVRMLPAAKRKLFDWSAFKEAPYTLFTLGGTIGFAGLYIPFFYIQYFSIVTGATDENLGFYLLAIINSASVFGRTLPNLFAARLGGLNIITPCAVVTALLIWILLAVTNLSGVVVFCIFYGFFSGTFVSLPPSVFVSLTKNRALIGTRMGMGFACMGFGVLAGTPIAGAILGTDANDLHFDGIWIFGAACTSAGAALFVGARLAVTGWRVMVKA